MLNVTDVLALDVGDMVPGVKGILKIAFKRSEGIGRDKTGSVQTAFLKQVDGEQEIKLKLWDREDISNLTGKQVWLVAKQGTTGLTGLKVELDAYTNAKGEDISEKVLVVKKQTEIARHDGRRRFGA